MAKQIGIKHDKIAPEAAEKIVHEYAAEFKDVTFTDPKTRIIGFTAFTSDDQFIVKFGWDDANDSFPGWYYSVAATEDYAHSATGSGMRKAGQAKHLISKVIGGETWYSKH